MNNENNDSFSVTILMIMTIIVNVTIKVIF